MTDEYVMESIINHPLLFRKSPYRAARDRVGYGRVPQLRWFPGHRTDGLCPRWLLGPGRHDGRRLCVVGRLQDAFQLALRVDSNPVRGPVILVARSFQHEETYAAGRA